MKKYEKGGNAESVIRSINLKDGTKLIYEGRNITYLVMLKMLNKIGEIGGKNENKQNLYRMG